MGFSLLLLTTPTGMSGLLSAGMSGRFGLESVTGLTGIHNTHITKPDQVKTYHDQVGYWLWEPATGNIIHTLSIPRGMITMATGKAASNAKQFELLAKEDDRCAGISSNPFLDYAFRTVEFRIQVSIHDDGTWSYEQDTVMKIKDQEELFHHVDNNTLHKIGEATPNPLAR